MLYTGSVVPADADASVLLTLALSCEGDTDNIEFSSNGTNSEGALTWLQMKKLRKASSTSTPTISQTLAEEFDKFCSEPSVGEDTNPYEWWASNRTKFPNVAAVSRVYLAIPASSVASERIFSKCGQVCSERRAALTPQHVEHLVFLSHNLNNC
jgi:hypothetical protein